MKSMGIDMMSEKRRRTGRNDTVIPRRVLEIEQIDKLTTLGTHEWE